TAALRGKHLFKATVLASSLTLLLGGCAATQETKPDTSTKQVVESADSRYQALADGIYEKLQAQNPWQSNELPDMSAEALKLRADEQKVWLEQLDQVDVNALSRQNQINHRMLTYCLKNDIDGYTNKEHYMPLNAEGRFPSNLGFIVRNASF